MTTTATTTITADTIELFALTVALWSACRATRRATASSVRTPDFVLTELAKDDHASIRATVACNTSATPATLQLLASDSMWAIRMHTAMNPSISTSTLAVLATDPIAEVRTAAEEALSVR